MLVTQQNLETAVQILTRSSREAFAAAAPPIGAVFGRLVVISKVIFSNDGYRRLKVKCLCGTVKDVQCRSLLSGHTKSCGCLNIEAVKASNTKHGLTKTPVHAAWRAMNQRCLNPRHKWYESYGGRGIKICAAWSDFNNFYKDMGDKPFPRASLERLNTNGDYEPSNCVWADSKIQNNNKRDNVLWEYKGKMYSVAALAELSGIKTWTLRARLLKLKWSVDRAVETQIMSPGEQSVIVGKIGPGAVRHKLYPQ